MLEDRRWTRISAISNQFPRAPRERIVGGSVRRHLPSFELRSDGYRAFRALLAQPSRPAPAGEEQDEAEDA
jgi:hypothetical protein